MSHAPAVYVVLRLEAAPRVVVSARRDTDEQRLAAWLATHPELAALVEHAAVLADGWQRRKAA